MKELKIDTDERGIVEILKRGVEEIISENHLRERLRQKTPLRVKFGIDPTGPKIHLGNAIPIRKLRAFQDLGHKVILVIGDFTAQIGDPSDKNEKRPMLSREEVKKNLKTYRRVIGKIINLKQAEWHYNSRWLSKLRFQEISLLAESFSVPQMLNRRNFKERWEKKGEISLREFLYPLMQGYDSVAVGADVEIGGSDQLFNLKAGRIVQHHYHMSEQDILTTEMLEGTDGRKMSKSWGNTIFVNDPPSEMFGKIMSINDSLIRKYSLLCTFWPLELIDDQQVKLSKGKLNPRDVKLKLAEDIVALYHGKVKARRAGDEFRKIFSNRLPPENLLEVFLGTRELLPESLVRVGIVSSKSEFRRLILGGAIETITGEKIKDVDWRPDSDIILKIGKRRFVKVITK